MYPDKETKVNLAFLVVIYLSAPTFHFIGRKNE